MQSSYILSLPCHTAQIPPAGKMQQHTRDVPAQTILFETNSLGCFLFVCLGGEGGEGEGEGWSCEHPLPSKYKNSRLSEGQRY